MPRQITSVLELNHVALCLICDLCSVDLNTSAEQVVGMHDEAIKCVEYSPQSGRIFLLMLVITKPRDIIICSMLKDLCHVGNDNESSIFFSIFIDLWFFVLNIHVSNSNHQQE